MRGLNALARFNTNFSSTVVFVFEKQKLIVYKVHKNYMVAEVIFSRPNKTWGNRQEEKYRNKNRCTPF